MAGATNDEMLKVAQDLAARGATGNAAENAAAVKSRHTSIMSTTNADGSTSTVPLAVDEGVTFPQACSPAT
jgi:hypothetical protein